VRPLQVVTLLLLLASPAAAGLNAYTRIDSVGAWIVEQRVDEAGNVECRAFIPSGGTWFGSNVRINAQGALSVPPGVTLSESEASLANVRAALSRCQEGLLYTPSQPLR
jgi:hypothetical protein